MAVSFVATSTPATGTTTATPTLPTGSASGDQIYITAVSKPSTTQPPTPTSWTIVTSVAEGTGTNGAGTGPVRLTIFKRAYDGAWAMPAVTTSGTGAVMAVSATGFRPGASESFAAETTTSGSDTTSGTGFSATGAVDIALTTGDIVLALGGTTSSVTATVPTLTATGATIGTVTERADVGTTSGNDCSIKVHTAPVSAGTSSAAPVHGLTLSAVSTGGVLFLRVRTSAVAPTVGAGTDATIALTGTFSRTATESGGTPTSRTWVVNSGPAEVGNTLSTAAALSWTPSAAGTYVLRYSATNAAGTGTDDVQVTVTGGGGAGSITGRTSTVAQNASAQSITGTLPTDRVTGDLTVAIFGMSSTVALFTPPSGWTQFVAPTVVATDRMIAAYYRFDPPSAPVGTTTSVAGRQTCICQSYLGVNVTTPIDVAAQIVANAAGIPSLTGITTVSDNAKLISGIVADSSTGTFTVPSGMTLLQQTSGGGGRATAVADETKATAGATGSRTWASTATGLGHVGFLAALRPAGSAPAAALIARFVGISAPDTVRVQVKASNTASARLKVGTDSGVTAGVVFGGAVTPSADGNATLTCAGLTAGINYYYRIEMTDAAAVVTLDTGTVGRARTAPTGQSSFAFCFGSCCNAPDSAAYTAIAARADDLFIHLGDLYYYDGSGTGVPNFRTKMNGQIQASTFQSIAAYTPTGYLPSDHDGMNNNTEAGSDPTAWTNWNQVYRELIPTPTLPGGTTGVYYTYTWGRIRFIHFDGRSFKSAVSATDDASKTALGATQKQWFKDTLTAAAEPVIVIAQDGPWVAAPTPGDDVWGGYDTERTELGAFITASGKTVLMLAGDMHALAADDGTNNTWGGFACFAAAPFLQDSSIKGGPYTVSPYPPGFVVGAQQYGRVVVTDSGSQIAFAYTGYTSDNTQRVALTMTYTVPVVPRRPEVKTAAVMRASLW